MRLTVLAHCAASSFPTAVEPVNVSARTSGCEVNTAPTSCAGPCTTLKTPAGIPARSASSASASAESGVSLAGLSTIVQPAASAGPALRRIIADGKFHGVIAAQTPIGCLITTVRRPWPVGRDDVAVGALGLLGEPFDEAGAVDDLAARLGERLALFGGHDPRELVRVLDDQLVPAPQDRGALAREQPRPLPERTLRGRHSLLDLRPGGARDRGEQLAARGIAHIDGGSAAPVDPFDRRRRDLRGTGCPLPSTDCSSSA